MSCGLLIHPVLSPAIGQKPIEFAGFHRIDSSKDVREIFDGIDIVTLAGHDEPTD